MPPGPAIPPPAAPSGALRATGVSLAAASAAGPGAPPLQPGRGTGLGPLLLGIPVASAALLVLGWVLPQLIPSTALPPVAAALLLLLAVALLVGCAALGLRGWRRWCGPPCSPAARATPAAASAPVHPPPGSAPSAPSNDRDANEPGHLVGQRAGTDGPVSATAASPLEWQIDLLGQLPGLSLLLQPAASDWVVIAVHRSADRSPPGSRAPTAPWNDLPAGLSHERLQTLSQLLAAHPDWPAAAIRDCVMPDAGGLPGPGVRRLPLAEGACVVWLPPPAAASPPAPLLDERESIAYSVSHDLRAPIRVIEGFTRIVREDYGQVLDRVGNDHLDRVLGATTRMNSMIDALLALSRLSTQVLARQAVPLSDMAWQIAQELQAQAPLRRVAFDIEPGLVVQGDPNLLHCLLDNLLGNAWKYSARRECAHIGLHLQTRQLPADEGSSAAAQRVFEVSDDGAGFDMRFADRLFSPFQRLHSASEFTGNGVGLASVRRIVQRHGGEIWADAEVDHGARFYFTLA